MSEFMKMEGENLHANRFIQAGHVATHLRGTWKGRKRNFFTFSN